MIFADGFESGNLSAWTASQTDNGDLSASAIAALTGTYGMQAVVNDNNAIYVTDDTPNAETRYRARFYFDPNSMAMRNGNTHQIFAGYQGAATQVLRVEFRFSGGSYQIRAGLRNNASGWTYTAWYNLSDTAHAIEIDWQAGAGSGTIALWLDGTPLAQTPGVNNSARVVDRVQLGAVVGVDTGTRGTYFFDAFESRRQKILLHAQNTFDQRSALTRHSITVPCHIAQICH